MNLNTSSSSESDFEVLEIISNISVPRNLKRAKHKRDPFTYSDDDFKILYRLDKNTVSHLNDLISPALTPVSHRKFSLSVLEQIFITLRFYATGTLQISDTNVHKTTMSRVVYKVSKEITKLAKSYITMPIGSELQEVKELFYNIAGFPNVIGCIDGTHIPIQSPGGNLAELYRNKGGLSSINVQVVCDAKLNIRYLDAHGYGSTEDSIVFENSSLRTQLYSKEIDGHLLGDSAYPCSKYLMTPIINPSTNAEKLYNKAHNKTRNTIERTIIAWKNRFPCLSLKLRLNLQHTLAVITATAVLHNICNQQNDSFLFDTPEENIPKCNTVYKFSEDYKSRQLLVEQYFR